MIDTAEPSHRGSAPPCAGAGGCLRRRPRLTRDSGARPSAGRRRSVAGLVRRADRRPDKLDVATTVAPISSLARNIGGDRIRLHGIVPDATNSHTFEPSPSDATHARRRPT